MLTEPKPREVITIYEIDAAGDRNWARAVYNYCWVPQTDPFGAVHRTIDYPGVPVDHTLVEEKHGILLIREARYEALVDKRNFLAKQDLSEKGLQEWSENGVRALDAAGIFRSRCLRSSAA